MRWLCSSWFSAHTVSPPSTCFCSQPWPQGSAPSSTFSTHDSAKPSLRMPPGSSVVSVLAMTDMGAMAANPGGRCEATKSWVMPGYDRPTMPTLWCRTQGCAATISMTS